MVLFMVLFSINMGLLSMDDSGLLGSDTYIVKAADSSVGVGSSSTWADLNTSFGTIISTPAASIQSVECVPTGPLDFSCGLETLSSAASSVSYLASLFMSIGLYLLRNIPAVMAGYLIVLIRVADLLEPGIGPIHGLFYTIGGLLLMIFFFGMFFFVAKILSILRNVIPI